VDLACLDAEALSDYGKLCGWTLAKAHARSGDRRSIAAQVENSKAFTKHMLNQALTHADLAEDGHAELKKAIGEGMIQVSDVDVTPFIGPGLMRVGGCGHAAAPC